MPTSPSNMKGTLFKSLKTNDLARTIEFTEAEDMGKPLKPGRPHKLC